jgi:hypothetical protein
MNEPKILFVVHTYSSAPDKYGNSYFYSDILSTVTGKRRRVTNEGETSLLQKIRCLFGLGSDRLYHVVTVLPIRQWQDGEKSVLHHERYLKEIFESF